MRSVVGTTYFGWTKHALDFRIFTVGLMSLLVVAQSAMINMFATELTTNVTVLTGFQMIFDFVLPHIPTAVLTIDALISFSHSVP